MSDPIKILGICGSLREGSYSRLALEIALQGAASTGCEIELLVPNQLSLPFCKDESGSENDITLLKGKVASCHGLILSTPEYHGTFSGVLKNTLDLLSIDDMKGKIVGLIAVSGGAFSGNALNDLRNVCRALHATAIPQQVVIPNSWDAFDKDVLKDKKLQDRLIETGRQTARSAFVHSSHDIKKSVDEWDDGID